jgi:hypothetical protein
LVLICGASSNPIRINHAVSAFLEGDLTLPKRFEAVYTQLTQKLQGVLDGSKPDDCENRLYIARYNQDCNLQMPICENRLIGTGCLVLIANRSLARFLTGYPVFFQIKRDFCSCYGLYPKCYHKQNTSILRRATKSDISNAG